MVQRTLLLGASLALAATSCSGSDDAGESPNITPATTAAASTFATEPTDAIGSPATTASTAEPTAPPVSPTSESPTPPPTSPVTTEAPAERAIDRVPVPAASTVDELLALDRPIVIAHAGGDFEAPHSTLYAFTQAALAGADVLEMDVMLTADDVLVVHHDDTVDRTTDATGPVRSFTYAELAALDNAHWFVEGTWSDQSRPADAYALRGARTGDRPPPQGYGPDDFRVETFRSVASAFPDHVLDVEIKIQRTADGEPDPDRAARAAAALAEEIAELGRTDSVIVVSFDAATIAAFRELAPDVATSPALDTLVAWYVGEPVEFVPTDVVFQVPPFYEGVEVLTPDVVARARADGFDVWVWMDDTSTQETADFYRDLLARGVDGLIVSRPTPAVGVIDR
jgi:glycerophosphoryl diester phosphodiesterase